MGLKPGDLDVSESDAARGLSAHKGAQAKVYSPIPAYAGMTTLEYFFYSLIFVNTRLLKAVTPAKAGVGVLHLLFISCGVQSVTKVVSKQKPAGAGFVIFVSIQ